MIKNMQKFNKAFSLAEVIITMTILGVIIAFTVHNGKKLTPDMEKARFKKAYVTVENVTSELINNETLYPDEKGFKNLITVTNSYGETFGTEANPNTKFRDAFKFLLDIQEDGIDCPVWHGGNSKNICFKTDDGIVYGIPDTDFVSTNLEEVTVQRTDDTVTHSYLPITVYVNWDDKITAANMDEKAMFLGVRYNGQIKILYNTNCITNPNWVQCRAAEYINSSTLKKTGN